MKYFEMLTYYEDELVDANKRMNLNKELSKKAKKNERSASIYKTNAVILSSSQSIEDINAKVAQDLGYQIARRQTGGGAVITRPGSTIQYTLFLEYEQKQEFFKELAKNTGLSIADHGFLYYENPAKKTIGHAYKILGNGLIQLDGLANLNADFVNDAISIIKPRQIYEEGFVKINEEFYTISGKKIIPTKVNGQELLEESELIKNLGYLQQIGIEEQTFKNSVIKSIQNMGYEINPTQTPNIQTQLLNEGKIKGKGHCFVYAPMYFNKNT
ncbi:MAG: hypothetical protein ACMXX7_02175 [Candidatus Woesearchaeota archaeon]